MLGVGIDWSTEFHVVALGRADEGVFKVTRVEHEPDAVEKLVGSIAELEPDAARVRVVIETSHGALVERLLDAGYVVLPVNPDLIARRRGPAKKKDDAEDARLACELALDPFSRLRPMIPHSPMAAELRSIARDDERAARDQQRLVMRLKTELVATFPAALGFAARDFGGATYLRVLERWPTHAELAAATRDDIEELARKGLHRSPPMFADKVVKALAETHFVPRDYLVRAKEDTIRLTARQLIAIGAQRRVWERRIGLLLLGVGRVSATHKPREGPREIALPGGEIYLSFPGLGDRLAARVAGEIGDINWFETPNNLQCYAGKAPVTRHRIGLGQGVLRPAARPGQEPSRRPAGARQSLARDPVALPETRSRLRRGDPRGQPQPGAGKDRVGLEFQSRHRLTSPPAKPPTGP